MEIPFLSLIDKGLDKLVADKGEREALKLKARELDMKGEFHDVNLAMSAIVAEAQSKDPYTSRARPTFLYVMYIMILAAFPMGIVAVFSPETATGIITGVQAWLKAIPQELWMLFGVGYLGYVKKRSDDKEVMKGGTPKKILGIF